MESQSTYIKRLATYATHLSKIDLKTHPKRGQYTIVQLCEIMDGLPNYFELKTYSLLLDFHLWFPEDFYWSSRADAAILKGADPEDNPFSFIIDFLGLRNTHQTLHIFSITGLQSPQVYGGRFILEGDDFVIKDIVYNLSMFIRWRIAQKEHEH